MDPLHGETFRLSNDTDENILTSAPDIVNKNLIVSRLTQIIRLTPNHPHPWSASEAWIEGSFGRDCSAEMFEAPFMGRKHSESVGGGLEGYLPDKVRRSEPGILMPDRHETVKMPVNTRKTTEDNGGGAGGTIEDGRWSLTPYTWVDAPLQ